MQVLGESPNFLLGGLKLCQPFPELILSLLALTFQLAVEGHSLLVLEGQLTVLL
jgi:hypothetical protein